MEADRIGIAKSQRRRAHLRVLFAVAMGGTVGLALQGADVATRGLTGWDICVIVLLAGIAWMMATTSVPELRLKAARQDETAPVILGLMLTAVGASLFGIFAEVNNASAAAGNGAVLVPLALVTLVLSWLCMHTLFAVHYAHRYYKDPGEDKPPRPGLIFPEDRAEPGYVEFVYFSFCIGMTYQVSDIGTGTRSFRTLVTLHGVLSFFYNTFVLALAVSLFSGLSNFR